jgi:uncharacterized protein YbjT (DUF2867 family)
MTTLVLGGTGKTGRRVVRRLAARGHPVRVGNRSGEPPFDWEDPDTWAEVLSGVQAVYLCYAPDLAVPGAVERVGGLAELAVGLGVRRLVLLSGRGEDEARRCERAVQAAGADWTVLRCAWFCQNFSEGYLLGPVVGGEVLLPAGAVPEPFVDAEDIAEVAAAALTQKGHGGQIYELTGPRLLTFAEAVGEIAGATGRPIRYGQISPDQYGTILAGQGVPAEILWLMRYLFVTVLDGRNAQLADGVQRALGRAPRDFADYALDAAATGVWGGVRRI